MAGEREIVTIAAEVRAGVEQRLGELAQASGAAGRLHDAMRYSLLAPAKRVRAVLAVLAGRALAAPPGAVLDSAAAIEMVHAASLILDDLPAMDNAELRRGRQANHRAFGEATAILAAVALLARAFEVLAAIEGIDDARRTAMCGCLARTVGPDGLTGGQERDLHALAASASGGEVEWVHARKTGALFAAALELAAIAAGADRECRAALGRAGLEIGLAFQAYDDLIDVLASPESAAKDVGRDGGKATAVVLLGAAGAERLARSHLDAAMEAIASLGANGALLRTYIAHLTESLRAPLAAASLDAAIGAAHAGRT